MRVFLTIVVAMSAIMLPSVSARSDETPVLNVLPLCQGIVSQGADPLQAGDPSVSLKQCLDAEQEDRGTMKKECLRFRRRTRKLALPKQRWAVNRAIPISSLVSKWQGTSEN